MPVAATFSGLSASAARAHGLRPTGPPRRDCKRLGRSRYANVSVLAQAGEGYNSHHQLRLYIDSADQRDWEELWSSGIFYGMTTNPVLLERAKVGCNLQTVKQLASAAFDLGAEEFQIQTWGDTLEEVVSNAQEIRSHDPRIVVKVPITMEGLSAAKQLTSQGARVTMTGVYTAHQALSAVAVNAEYAAPYLGRICNMSSKEEGMAQCIRMQRISDTAARSRMRILVASIKDADDMATLAEQGLDTFTFSPGVARQMLHVDDTIQAASDFDGAAKRMASASMPVYQ
eukprot:jgi/Tetstr1/464772/TSEL_009518.t1